MTSTITWPTDKVDKDKVDTDMVDNVDKVDNADMDKSLESREISRNTDLARSLSLEKIEFSFSFSSPFSRFWRKNSLSLLDLWESET